MDHVTATLGLYSRWKSRQLHRRQVRPTTTAADTSTTPSTAGIFAPPSPKSRVKSSNTWCGKIESSSAGILRRKARWTWTWDTRVSSPASTSKSFTRTPTFTSSVTGRMGFSSTEFFNGKEPLRCSWLSRKLSVSVDSLTLNDRLYPRRLASFDIESL